MRLRTPEKRLGKQRSGNWFTWEISGREFPNEFDTTYSPDYEHENLMMGNSPIAFDNNFMMVLDGTGKKLGETELLEKLPASHPSEYEVSDNYKDMLVRYHVCL